MMRGNQGTGRFLRAACAMLLIGATPVGARHAPPPHDTGFGDGGVSAFYAWTGAKPARPGIMLRQENVGEGYYVDHADLARRILYSTTDGRFDGGVVAASGLLYLPKGDPPKGGWPLLIWGHGTTGIADICAPSWNRPLPRDGDFVDAWLQKGYAVVAPDYQGLGTPGAHPYLGRRGEGYSTLDAARAAIMAYPDRISNRVILAGQSQGSGAVLNAAYLAPSYAPRLGLLGAIATGLVWAAPLKPGEADPITVIPASPRLNIMRMMSGGLRPGSPPPEKLLSEKGMAIAQAARTICSRGLSPIARSLDLTPQNAYTLDPLKVAGMLIPTDVPARAIRIPVLVGTGLADDLIAPTRQFRGAEAMCRAGTHLFWRGYAGVTHNGSLHAGLADGQAFAADLLAGRKVASNCAAMHPPGALQAPRAGLPFND